MNNNRINARLAHKIDVETNWNKATFTPLAGEFIIYAPDDNYSYSRLKIGTGTKTINELDFMSFSAYDIAVAGGYEGTEKEWLASLVGNGISTIKADRLSSGSNGEMKVTVNMTNGSYKDFSVFNGEKGDKGDKGDTGIGVAAVNTASTTEAGAANVVTITLTNDKVETFKVYNGKNGTVTPE